MNRTDRLYALVEELRAISPRCRSARELAARFEVSPRTIERDISALQQSGVPIYAEPGRRGGYAIDARMSLPPLNFTPAEAVAIALALSRTEDRPFAAYARTALRKVVAAMPGRDGERARDLAARIGFLPLIPGPRDGRRDPAGRAEAPEPDGARARAVLPDAGEQDALRGRAILPGAAADGTTARSVVRAIEDALLHRHVLRIEYTDRTGSVTVREVEPGLFLGGSHGVWYLSAWCRLRDEVRVFRLDRIRSASPTGERAPARPSAQFVGNLPDTSILLHPALD
ncbi:WYL domain-containing protein [Thermopolyspora sp. NPDC052614]|uniref:helix-turn-helix transcriptional regulator n=1 Tax=Thermopolyspora sp. NPDC052614 TaxID=3155682 RepID=UPI00343D970E